MSGNLATSLPTLQRLDGDLRRVAFVGQAARLNAHVPSEMSGMASMRLDVGRGSREQHLSSVRDFDADALVLIDPPLLPAATLMELCSLPALTLGLLPGELPDQADRVALGGLDRVVCFDPALVGAALGQSSLWRAVPPPISDALFGQARRLQRRPRAMSIGRSTEHREAMLLPTKHHHDLLQLIHGVCGDELTELLREYDVGVYVTASPGEGFGTQAAIHLAAGHLLLAERLRPAHGLERDIDYLEIRSPANLEWTLKRIGQFPEMYYRLQVRGRMKAEQFRASRIFARLLHDLFADVAAFGRSANGPKRRT